MTFVMGIFVGMGVGAFVVTLAYLIMATTKTSERDKQQERILETQEKNTVAFETMANAMQKYIKRL